MPSKFIVKDSGKRESFSTGAVRDIRAGKGRYDLVSPVAIRRLVGACGGRYDAISPYAMKRLARIYEAGSVKYNPRNWEAGMPISRVLDSALRHTYQYLAGLRDEDHLAQASWNLFAAMFYEEMVKRGKLPKSLLDTMNYSPPPVTYVTNKIQDGAVVLHSIYLYIEGSRTEDHLVHAARALFDMMHAEGDIDAPTTTPRAPTTHTCTITKTPPDDTPRHNGRVLLACPSCGKIGVDSFMIGTGFIKCKLCGHKVTAGRRDTAVIRWNEESRKKWK